MTNTKGEVSLSVLMNELQAEVEAFVRVPSDWEPVAVQPGDTLVGDVSESAEVQALFHLRNRYTQAQQRYAMSYAITRKFPQGVSEYEASEAVVKAGVYDLLFWQLLRRLSGQYGPSVAVREGFKVALPSQEEIDRATGATTLPQATAGSGLVN